MRRSLLFVVLMSCTSSAAGQSTLRLELGVGAGVGGVNPGAALRLGAGISVGQWGGLVRFSGHRGKRLGSVLGFPVEEFVGELGALATYGLLRGAPQRLLIGVGIGRAQGERLGPTECIVPIGQLTTVCNRSLVEFPAVWGMPFEMTWHLGDGRGFGASLSADGHLNGEASFVALILSVTFGLGV